MGNRPRISEATKVAVLRSVLGNREVARKLGIDEASVRRIRAKAATVKKPVQFLDKKIGGFNWRDSIPAIKGMQALRKKGSWGQQFATIKVGNGVDPIGIMLLSDTHIGAMGTDYDLFVELTDIIMNTPNLYFVLNGDEVEFAIKLRGVAEVCAQVLDPGLQDEFIESWVAEVSSKMLWATWSNHSTERAEAGIGFCPIKKILAKKVPFFSGIGHADIIVGKEVYKAAVSHKFQGVTAMDVTAGCRKYLRMEAPDRELAIQGDAHRAGISLYNEGGTRRLAVCSGTLNVASGFAQRYCSVKTSTAFPVIKFYPDKHIMIPFMSIAEYMLSSGVDYDGSLCNY